MLDWLARNTDLVALFLAVVGMCVSLVHGVALGS